MRPRRRAHNVSVDNHMPRIIGSYSNLLFKTIINICEDLFSLVV